MLGEQKVKDEQQYDSTALSNMPANGLQLLSDDEIGMLRTNLSASVVSWLQDKSFLTDKLTATFRADCRLRLLREDDCVHLEKFDLPISIIGEKTFSGPGRLREVAQQVNQQCWIFARTLIPSSTLHQEPRLRQLGDQALGTFLQTKNAQRSNFGFFTVASTHTLLDSTRMLYSQQEGGQPRLGRCSRFTWSKGQCSVVEIFTPRFLHALQMALESATASPSR